jgi:hypothetical protein
MKTNKYTKEQLIEAVKTSFSIAQTLTKLDIKPCGGNYSTIKKHIKEFSIDTSHFTGQKWNKGQTSGPKRPIEEYLNNNFPIHSHKLRLRLLKEKFFLPVCSSCNTSLWKGKPIPLELHHIDGNNKNNVLSNLEILCPNCHSQTENFRGKNKS